MRVIFTKRVFDSISTFIAVDKFIYKLRVQRVIGNDRYLAEKFVYFDRVPTGSRTI